MSSEQAQEQAQEIAQESVQDGVKPLFEQAAVLDGKRERFGFVLSLRARSQWHRKTVERLKVEVAEKKRLEIPQVGG